MMKKKIMCVFGTRPEAIKMAPLVNALKNQNDFFDTIVCVTGQHRQLLDQVLALFEIKPDFDLNIMKPSQDLYDITAQVLLGLRDVLRKVRPDLVLVHGDTTTSMSAALASFYEQIPVGHVEAGLRTHDLYNPWPEELNRMLTGKIASIHFSPTTTSKKNLHDEGVLKNVYITGNTVIDALHLVSNKINDSQDVSRQIYQLLEKAGLDKDKIHQWENDKTKLVLITGHRRENFGEHFLQICNALKILAEQNSDVDFVYPMHLNPNVRTPIKEVFGSSRLKNIFFIEPLDYLPFVFLLEKSTIVLTDSGGIQEEAPGFGKPVLVMRETTERPEAVEAGTVKLVGTNSEKIVQSVTELLYDENCYKEMAHSVNPYGDGTACEKIVSLLKLYLK